ncbi:B12-binding domain-containing radical SAM protein [Geobacter sp. AOG1]|uniref:B12-binding domain-containing radical SAM protein n=1 Tax=Geobacter sp. AOG1 TaxID=1566346 RepID=UPI001CC36301|nr:radical SAM protein [Geobacter sp. AOG1]GFE56614.1 B12-binding domain-containing radical SAM protein [Geobacter sp. AOG1]
MNVILTAIHPYSSPQAIPLANGYLKASLAADEELANRVRITLHDFFVGDQASTCAARILAAKPDAVGFSIYLWNRRACLEVARLLREARPELTLFAGGPEPTAAPEGMLADFPFDFLILGEGEHTFVEAMGKLSAGGLVRDIKGIAVLDDGRVLRQPRPPIPFLDTLPSPYLNGQFDIKPGGGALWQLSRGCSFGCDFCFDYQGAEGVRRFGMERVSQELDWFVQHRVAQVFVLDSTFNRDLPLAKAILRLIRKVAPHIHFHFEVRSEFIDAELARLFSTITCSLQIGLQSAHPSVLKGLRRSLDPADFSARADLLNQSGAIFGFDLMYGLPGDTLAGFEQSLDFALGLYPNHLDIFPLAVLPGTPLAGRASSLGLDYLPTPPYTVLASPSFPAKAMGEAATLATACDIFYSRGKAVAWFTAICKGAKLTPAKLFRSFACWMKTNIGGGESEEHFADDTIWQMQRAFLHHLYNEKRQGRLLPAALDLVDYHYHFAAALMASPPDIPTDRSLERRELLDEPFCLAPSARLATFSYEIYDFLEAGEIDLREFTACFAPSGSWAVIYPRGNEVFTESLIEPYFRILASLDGRTPVGQIAVRLGIPAAEAREFIEFAAAEGIATSNCSW